MNYEWQDVVERRATHILEYLYYHQGLKEKFSRGFEDVLIAGEEIYCVDIESGEPVLRKCNPLNVHTIRSGESPWIDDADIIIEDGHFSQGQILDKFHEELSNEHITCIEEGFTTVGNSLISIGEKEASFMLDNTFESAIIDTDSQLRSGGQFKSTYDSEGNIRVMRVVWKSKRKVGKLKYWDIEGNPFETIVDEKYEVKPTEEVTWVWINEWWEGTRIGGGSLDGEKKAIYIKIQRRPIQFRSIHNISKCSSGYVGLAYNTNVSKSKSLMDRMKPYQYLYNVFMYRTELAFARAKGKIGKLELSKMPDGWTPQLWMHYAEVNGWIVEDSFNEGVRGAAQGKLAGSMSGSSSFIDLDLGNYIQQHIMMLQFIETQMGQIAGISRQREGNIENRETVRGVERAVVQSNLITEKYFTLHDMVKVKAMCILLETAKYAWKGKEKILQYVSDDLTNQVFNIEANDDIMDCDAGVILTSGQNDADLISSLKEFAHAVLQNDKITFKQILDIYMNPSLTSMRRKIELSEMQKESELQKQSEQAQKMQTEQLGAAKEAQEAQRAFDMAKIDKEYAYKIQLEKIKGSIKQNSEFLLKDLDNNGIIDELELERERTKINLANLKTQSDALLQSKQQLHESKEKEKDRNTQKELAKITAKSKNKSK